MSVAGCVGVLSRVLGELSRSWGKMGARRRDVAAFLPSAAGCYSCFLEDFKIRLEVRIRTLCESVRK